MDGRENLVLEGVELIPVPEEVGLVGRESLDDLVELVLTLLAAAQVSVVLVETLPSKRLDSPRQALLQKKLGIRLEQKAAVLVDDIADQVELARVHLEFDR